MFKRAVFLLANIIVLISPIFTSYSVKNANDLQHAKFGLPFSFVGQDLTQYDPPFPIEMRFSSPWENPTSILWPAFLASLFLVNGLIYLIFYLLNKMKR